MGCSLRPEGAGPALGQRLQCQLSLAANGHFVQGERSSRLASIANQAGSPHRTHVGPASDAAPSRILMTRLGL